VVIVSVSTYLTTVSEIHEMLERVLGGDTRHMEPRAAELAVEDFELYLGLCDEGW
jgi:hypothetical protein